MSNQPNQRIGDYEILNELGRGGMGRVYRVRNVISDRVEAMKVLLPELAGRQELAARFLREIKLVASLDHPNISALRTALMLDDQLVMIMEYVEGTSLAERLQHGPLPVAKALDYTDQVLSALSYAHQRGVIHRDLKPANLMLTSGGVVKVMDFGIAFSSSEHKLTVTGTTLGSLAYMSPEQVQGEVPDPRSDLYSLGISLYEMATGQQPFRADSDFAIMLAHLKEIPRPPIELQPGLPAALNAVILQAIAKEKEKRFQSADAFRSALSGAAAGGPAGVRTSTVLFTPSTAIPVAVPAPKTSYSQPSAEPAPTMAAAPAPAIPPARQGGHRALYMALGAFLALALLIVAGTYYRSGAAGSKQDQATLAPVSKAEPVAQPAAEPPAPPAPAAQPAADPPARPAPAEAAEKAPSSPARNAPVAPPATPVEKANPTPDNSAQLDELETQIDQLTSRVLAVDASLETLRQQQRAAGYDLRGDMATKWESMKLNLVKAQLAWQARDVAKGKRHADLAETACGQLERFLGR